MFVQVNFTLTPLQSGSLKICRIEYLFGDIVRAQHCFHKRGKRLDETAEHRRSAMYSADHSLMLLVTSPMPLLSIDFPDFPAEMFEGEIVQSRINIQNRGDRDLKQLILALSHPEVLYVGSGTFFKC